MPCFAAPDFVLNYRDAGNGPAIVALHAFPLDGAMWRFQSEALSDVARWIVPDLRGFGGSSVRDAERSHDALPPPHVPAQLADDVAALLNHLGLERAILAGVSMGGYVAFEFALRHRDRLAGLILCDTRADADPPARRADRRKLAEDVLRRGPEAAADAFSPKLLSKQTRENSPQKASEIVATILRQPAATIAATSLGLGERRDMTSHLGAIDVPTLVVCGEDDLLTPADEMRSMASAMPDARFVAIPGAGHLAPFERPDAVNEEIRTFLARRFALTAEASSVDSRGDR